MHNSRDGWTMPAVMLVLAVIAAVWVYNKKEMYGPLDDGACECCECGWQSCKACAANIKQCCGGRLGGFKRYTFLPVRRGEDEGALDLVN